jgi:hypothetical protein
MFEIIDIEETRLTPMRKLQRHQDHEPGDVQLVAEESVRDSSLLVRRLRHILQTICTGLQSSTQSCPLKNEPAGYCNSRSCPEPESGFLRDCSIEQVQFKWACNLLGSLRPKCKYTFDEQPEWSCR